VYWQPFDSGGWGLVQSNPGDNWVGPPNPKFYVMAQFSSHLRPGMQIIRSGDHNSVAAYDASRRTLVIVTVNFGTAQWIDYDLSRFTTVQGPITRWMTNTGGGDMHIRHTDTFLSGKKFWSWFPANTVQTFEVQGVYQ
jgi:galactan endo-1,6-beta-galactosidase